MASGEVIRIGGGIDWSKYTPLSLNVRDYTIPFLQTRTVIEISGKGYISCFLARHSGTLRNNRTEFFLDDQLVLGINHMADSTNGIYTLDSVYGDSGGVKVHPTGAIPGLNTNLYHNDNTAGFKNLSISLAKPIFFNSSLRLVIQNQANFDGIFHAFVRGGIN